jgi:hypothetical protein
LSIAENEVAVCGGQRVTKNCGERGLFAGRPDWANFSLLGDCFLWADFFKFAEFWDTFLKVKNMIKL